MIHDSLDLGQFRNVSENKSPHFESCYIECFHFAASCFLSKALCRSWLRTSFSVTARNLSILRCVNKKRTKSQLQVLLLVNNDPQPNKKIVQKIAVVAPFDAAVLDVVVSSILLLSTPSTVATTNRHLYLYSAGIRQKSLFAWESGTMGSFFPWTRQTGNFTCEI